MINKNVRHGHTANHFHSIYKTSLTVCTGHRAFSQLSSVLPTYLVPVWLCIKTPMSKNSAHNVEWHLMSVNKAARAELNNQQPCVIWFTGLSGSGKSTVADILEQKLHRMGRRTYVLDGDNVRQGLSKDLGFADLDRVENIRRVAEVAKLMVDAGLITIVAFISPFQAERDLARNLFDDNEFYEIFMNTPIEVCEARDPKGLYHKARTGMLKNFTGIDSVYEKPANADLVLDGATTSADALADQIIQSIFMC